MRMSLIRLVFSSLVFVGPRPQHLVRQREERETPWAHQPRRQKLPKRKVPPAWKHKRGC
jgi:hypothetical protein